MEKKLISLIVTRYKDLPWMNLKQIDNLNSLLFRIDPNIAYQISDDFEKHFTNLHDNCSSEEDDWLCLSIFNPIFLSVVITEAIDANSYASAADFCRKNKELYKPKD